MKKRKFRQVLRAVNNYVVFFLMLAFVVSCCMILFVSVLADTMGLVFTTENIGTAAKQTFGNVVLITLFSGTFDYIRRRQMVDRPVKRILQAAEKVMQGDFSVRIEPVKDFCGETGFNEIIGCFNKMTEELAGTETLRTDFIANVSHELKTPLAVMGNYATILQNPGLAEEERREYAKAISDASRRLGQGLGASAGVAALGMIGYDATLAVQSGGTVFGIKVLCLLFPAICAVGSWVVFRFVWNITPELKEEMARKREALAD